MDYRLFIASRYIKSRKKGVFAILTTLIAIAGVTVGVAALIITLSVMNGFKSDIQQKILGTQSHIVVMSRGDDKIDVEAKINKIEKFPDVLAASPFIYGQAILKFAGLSDGTVIKGIVPESENKTTNLADKISEGSLESISESDNSNIILGKELAQKIGAKMGDQVVLVSPHGIETPFGSVPQMEVFTVTGIFHVGMYEFDAHLAYLSIAKAQKLFNLAESVSGFGVKIKDIYRANYMAERMSIYLDYRYSVKSWMEMNKNLFSALKLEKTVMFIILTLIILVAAFNIVSNLFLLTMEKYRDIGVLRALGAKISDIKAIFIIEGLITGGIGIICGSAIGVAVSLLLDKYRFIKLPSEVYYIDTLPVKILWSDLYMVVAVAVLIAFLSTIYPASKAAKVNPVEAIRYGG